MNHRATIVLVAALMSSPSWAAVVLQGPALTMDPNGVTPLAAVVNLTTDVPTKASMVVTDLVGDTRLVEFADFNTAHALPVLGMKPETTYLVQVDLTDQLGNAQRVAPVLWAVTGPLPADFPQIAINYAQPDKMEPGYIMMDRFRRFGTPGALYTIIVDNKGDVVWYSTLGGQDGTRKLPNGNLQLLDLAELTLLGEVLDRGDFDSPGYFLHHDLYPAASGNFFSLAISPIFVDDFPTSEFDPAAPTATTEIYTDIVVEFLPDGSQLNTWDLTDIIDPTRIGYDAVLPGFPLFDKADWSHSNAVVYDPTDDSVIVSVRHQDAVIKFSRATGNLIWILGPHDNWGPAYQPYLLTPVGSPFEWQYHQHAPVVTPQGTVLLFDNGNYRASPFDGMPRLAANESYSRAVEFEIDEVNMEVRQVWEYGANLDWLLFSPTQGDADWMPTTGNVLITMSDTRFIAGVPSSDWGLGARHTTVIEVDHETPANKLFEMRLYDPIPGGSISAYRSEKIGSLYADNVVVRHDNDNDTVLDDIDNCTSVSNPHQRDTNGDGFGNLCDPDLNNDGFVEFFDLYLLQQVFGSSDPDADFDGNGVVNFVDLQILLQRFFGVPGPSALVP